MIDYKPFLIEQLDTILPTYYELFADSTTETPCITIMESNNAAEEEGNTIRFSRIAFYVKIWCDDIGIIAKYGKQVDQLMYSFGFERVSYQELWLGNQCSAIYRYEILADESTEQEVIEEDVDEPSNDNENND